MFRKNLLFCLFLALPFFTEPAFSQTSAFSPDQKALLAEALRAALVTEKNLPEYGALKNKKEILVLDKMVNVENPNLLPVFITPEILPDLDDVKLILVNDFDLKKKKHRKDLVFVRLAHINQPETEYGIVHLFGQWQLGKKSRKKGFVFREAGGYTMLFRKTDGVWKFDKVINRFPNSLDQQKY